MMKLDKSKYYYLAGPYTHRHKSVVAHRLQDHRFAEYWLLQQGIHVIGPINSSGALEQVWKDLPVEYEFWQERDRRSIEYTDGVILIKLHGWENSVGVMDELEYAAKLKKPIYVLKPIYDFTTGYVIDFELENMKQCRLQD